MNMDPNSKASAVLRLLSDGPATTGEVAAEFGWTSHLACAHLSNLRRKRKVVSAKARIPTGGRPAQLWQLPGAA